MDIAVYLPVILVVLAIILLPYALSRLGSGTVDAHGEPRLAKKDVRGTGLIDPFNDSERKH